MEKLLSKDWKEKMEKLNTSDLLGEIKGISLDQILNVWIYFKKGIEDFFEVSEKIIEIAVMTRGCHSFQATHPGF